MARLSRTKQVFCVVCFKQFFTSRQEVKTCSSACRQKLYRHRQAQRQAARQAQMGLPFENAQNGSERENDGI